MKRKSGPKGEKRQPIGTSRPSLPRRSSLRILQRPRGRFPLTTGAALWRRVQDQGFFYLGRRKSGHPFVGQPSVPRLIIALRLLTGLSHKRPGSGICFTLLADQTEAAEVSVFLWAREAGATT
ncbi:hypothetical protein M3Y99_00223900 [Aphelenchoides fujianensis]|nr:hypothetical protein M3Y99_00223900 [Aphelenchoides fujianensis]